MLNMLEEKKGDIEINMDKVNEIVSDVEDIRNGLSTPQRHMFELVEVVKDGPWFT